MTLYMMPFHVSKQMCILISFSSDYLFFPSEMEHIAKMMKRNGQTYSYLEVESNYGHDAFLVELDKFEENIKDVLQ